MDDRQTLLINFSVKAIEVLFGALEIMKIRTIQGQEKVERTCLTGESFEGLSKRIGHLFGLEIKEKSKPKDLLSGFVKKEFESVGDARKLGEDSNPYVIINQSGYPLEIHEHCLLNVCATIVVKKVQTLPEFMNKKKLLKHERQVNREEMREVLNIEIDRAPTPDFPTPGRSQLFQEDCLRIENGSLGNWSVPNTDIHSFTGKKTGQATPPGEEKKRVSGRDQDELAKKEKFARNTKLKYFRVKV